MQPQSSPTRLIPLTQGLWALVDEVDYPTLSAYKWYAETNTSCIYAARGRGLPQKGNIWMHRMIMEAAVGTEVDHRNMDGLDNRRCNLRMATKPQNSQNRSAPSNNTSGYKGVSFDSSRNRWAANITALGTHYRLGRFTTPEAAARAYDVKALEVHGEFACLNFPQHLEERTGRFPSE